MSDRISQDTIKIRQRLLEYYSSPEADVWLHSPLKLLDGQTAFDLIEKDKTAEIERLLDQLDSGAYI